MVIHYAEPDDVVTYEIAGGAICSPRTSCCRMVAAGLPVLDTSSLGEPCKSCKKVDDMVATEFLRSRMGGKGSLTVGVGDKLVWTKSYGNAESETSLATNQDTVYRIGSITKMFTALCWSSL